MRQVRAVFVSAPTLDRNASGMAHMQAISPTRAQALAEEGIRAFKEHMRVVERMYVHIHNISMPKMTVHPDGRVEYEHSEWTKEALAEIDKLAAQIKDGFPYERYGLKRPVA